MIELTPLARPYAKALFIKIKLEFEVIKNTKKIINKTTTFMKYFTILDS